MGLITLSLTLAIALLFVIVAKSRWLYGQLEKSQRLQSVRYFLPAFDVSLAIVLCLISLALVTQIHYFYYQKIIDGLPDQWVVGAGLSIERIDRFLRLSYGNSIADYANGLVLWVCIGISVLYPMVSYRRRWSIYLLWVVLSLSILRLIYHLMF